MTNAEIETALKELGYDRLAIASYRFSRIPDKVRIELFGKFNPDLKGEIVDFIEGVNGFGKNGK